MPTDTPQEQKEIAREFKPGKDALADLISECNHDVSRARDGTSTWRDRLAENYNRRRGMVGKADADFPWKNSSNLTFRSEEKKLRKVNSAFVLSIQSAPKIARFIPLEESQGLLADDHEYLLQWQMWGQDKRFFRKVKLLANQRNHHGPCVVKIIWHQSSTPGTKVFTREEFQEKLKPYADKIVQAAQQGAKVGKDGFLNKAFDAAVADIFGWDLEDKTYKARVAKVVEQWKSKGDTIRVIANNVESYPVMIPVYDLTLLNMPSDTGCIQEAEWISQDIPMSERELRQRKNKYKNVDDLLDSIKDACDEHAPDTEKEIYKDAIRHASGISDSGDIAGLIYVREMYRWVPRKLISEWKGEKDDEDTPVKAIITYCPDVGDDVKPLRIMELPYDHGMWPFEEDVFNLSEDQFYNAEGLGQMLAPYSEEYDISRNAAIDRHTLTLSPPTLIWSQSKITASSFRQVGQAMYTPIPPERAIHIPQHPDLSRGFEMDAQRVDQDMDDVAGVPSLSGLGSYGAPPTKEQIDQTVGPAQAIQQAELASWCDFFARICRHFYELNKQFLFPLLDQRKGMQVPKMMGTGFVKITPQHFQGDYFILCGADVSRTNPQFETQKLIAWYQLMMSDPNNAPFLKHFDIKYLLASRMIGHIDAQTCMQPREQADQLNKQFVDSVAQKKAEIEVAMEKARERGAKPRGSQGSSGGGPLKEMTGAYGGQFMKSTGT